MRETVASSKESMRFLELLFIILSISIVPLVTIYSYSTLKRTDSLYAPKSAPAASSSENVPKTPINIMSTKQTRKAASQMPIIAARAFPFFFTAIICSKKVSIVISPRNF